MKRKVNVKKRKTLLLTAAMVAGLVLGTLEPTVQAEEVSGTDKTIAGFGTSVIANPIAPTADNVAWKGSYVYYGNYDADGDGTAEPVKYRVLANNTTLYSAEDEKGNKAETMLLDCDSVLYKQVFDDTYNGWAKSDIYNSLNEDGGFLDIAFTAIEKSAIAESNKSVASSIDGDGESSLYYAPLSGEQIFLLDAKEATNTKYGYSSASDSVTNRVKRSGGKTDYWWLRSALSYNIDMAGYILPIGDISWGSVYGMNPGVSPAFNVDLSSVLFSSVVTGTAGETGAEYKLTLLDDNMNIAGMKSGGNETVTRSGNTVIIPYTITGDNKGKATQVSVLLTDKAYTEDDAEILSYKKLQITEDHFNASGTGTFTLPSELKGKECGTDYYAYIIAEDVNEEKVTDYASTPVEISVPDKPIGTVTVSASVTAPIGGQPFVATAAVSEKGVKTSAVWKKGSSTATGNAEYNTTYTASLMIVPDTDYYFMQPTTITLNGAEVESDKITSNGDGTITIHYGEYTTPKAKLLEIPVPSAITEIANRAAKTAEALGLPEKVSIKTEDVNVTSANVTWYPENLADESYDPFKLEEQTFTVSGNVILSEEITNENNISLATTIQVTVAKAGTAAAPKANVASETYKENQSVQLSTTTAGADIYYTTDGTTPSKTNGTKYTGAITVTGTTGQSIKTTIKAVAIKDGMYDSSIATFEYIINIPKQEESAQNPNDEQNPYGGQTSQQETAYPAEGTKLFGIGTGSNKATYKVINAATSEAGTDATVEYVEPSDKKASKITIPDIIAVDGTTYKVTTIADKAFKNNKKITTVTIGSNITTIGKNAFYNCTNLKTVKIGKNVTTIGNGAFYNCKKLKTVTMGANVTTIGDKAFYKCTALTKITLPSKVNKIGKKAFYGCKKLKTITIKTKKLTSKKVGSKAFSKTSTKATVKVPKSKLKAYKKFLYKKGLNKKATIKK